MVQVVNRAAFTAFVLIMLVSAARSSSMLTMHVAPNRVTAAPGWLEVRATVETSSDNRALEIVAESDEYFRSSQIPLDGERAPRINEVLFKGLPQGQYAVSVTLVGVNGRRAAETQWFQVAPGIGR